MCSCPGGGGICRLSGWTLRDGAADPARWAAAAYSDRTLVTRVGPLHADQATEQDHPEGLPTSSSTLPTLVVGMYRHAMITDESEVLCVTGTGYGTALLAARLGDEQVTSVDLDPHLVDAARERLDVIGRRPTLAVCDITGPLPGEYDRIVSTVSVPGIPASWLTALRPRGRLVTTLAKTGLVIAADATPDGGARGSVTETRAGFMATRAGDDYPPSPDPGHAWADDGDEIGPGRYPVISIADTWELMSMVALAIPGVRHQYTEDDDGVRTAVMTHGDGSWSRATGRRGETPTVHQAAPVVSGTFSTVFVWTGCRTALCRSTEPAVTIDPDGTLHLSRGSWSATLAPSEGRSATNAP